MYNLKLKMKEEVQPELTREISSSCINSTSNVHPNEPSPCSLVIHAVGIDSTGTTLKLKMEEVRVEVTNEICLPAIVDSTLDVLHLNEIKKEFSLSEPHPYDELVEHAVVKCEDACIQSLDLQIKSELPDLNHDIKSDNDDMYINLEPLVNEELDIKNEVEESLVGDTKPTQANLFYCGICNSKLTSKITLRRHLNIHIREKSFQCNICYYKCSNKGNLQKHIETHTGEKPFKCSVCDYRCLRNSNLKRHMKTHTREKPFKCSVCEYKCIRKLDLQRHIKTHTGEKPFQCNMCVYKCIEKSTLQQHVKTHTGEKPFKCCLCDYRCVRKHDLRRHLKTHTAEKPFQCSTCYYKCIESSTLKRHMKTHTGEKPL